jgi:septal ring factor EnvC (AmiA/AmiB activator)
MSNKGILRKLHKMASNEQKLEPERNRAGNSDGLSLFGDIKSMKQEMKDLKGSLQEEIKTRQRESKKLDQDIRELSKRIYALEVNQNNEMVIM